MNKYTSSILSALLMLQLFSMTAHSQDFSKKITTNVREQWPCAILTADQSEIVYAAWARDPNILSTERGMVVGKTDLEGNLIWRKNYVMEKTKDRMVPGKIIEQADGYLIAGFHEYAIGDAMLMKIDFDGNLISFKLLHPQGSHLPSLQVMDMVVSSDGSLIMTGTVGVGHQHQNVLWLKTDATFSSYHVKKVVSGKDLVGMRIFSENNNKTVIAINSGDTYDDHTSFPSLMKMDANGNILKAKNFKLSSQANMNDCIRLADGSFVMVGTGDSHSFIMKVNSSFDLEWCRFYDLPYSSSENIFNSVTTAPDGGFIVSGSVRPSGAINPEQSVLMKADAQGNATTFLTSDGTVDQNVFHVFPISATSSIALGQASDAFTIFSIDEDFLPLCSYSFNSVSLDAESVTPKKNNLLEQDEFVSVYTVESPDVFVADEGSMSDYCAPLRLTSEQSFDNGALSLFPNPADDDLKIALPSSFSTGKKVVEVRNLLGQCLIRQEETDILFTLDIYHLIAGQYIVRVLNYDGTVLSEHLQVE